MNEQDLFVAALGIADLAIRAEFLDRECGAHSAKRNRIAELLAAHANADHFLESSETGAYQNVPAPAATIGTVFAGRYKLREVLGEGGMGTVYVADQIEPVQRRVAVKIISAGLDSGRMLARFEQERQALALMDHPNIAKVLDAGIADRTPYFVMELIKGVPLTRFCDEAKLTPHQRLELFVPVCQAVQHAHQKGIIHRDLKPSNILIGLYDGRPVPKVIDFGVAKATGARLTERSVYTEVGSLIGTLEYMSPEQAELNNLDIDTRSDIYALGVILYELLTGSVPFARKDLQSAGIAEMLRIIKEVDPPRPSTRLSGSGKLPAVAAVRQMEPRKLANQVKGELDWIVMKCLEKDRNRRYETANGLGMDIGRFLCGDPVLAGPPSKTYRFRKFVSRNRGRVTVAALLMLALVGGVVGTTLGMVRAGRAEAQAVGERDAAVEARREVLEALTDLTDSTVTNLLTRQPQLGKAEQDFLARVIARYERLIGTLASGGDAAELRARCLLRVGTTYTTLGNHFEALDAFQKATDSYREAAVRSPDDARIADELISVLNNRSVSLERLGRLGEQATYHSEAFELAKQCRQKFPDDNAIALGLSLMWHNQAHSHWSDPAARLEAINNAIALAESVSSLDRRGRSNLRFLGMALKQRGIHYSELGDVDAVQSDLNRLEKLATDRADRRAEIDEWLGLCQIAMADVLLRTNQTDAAMAHARRGVETLEKQLARSPGSSDLWHALIYACERAEFACRRCGRNADADAFLSRAAALADQAANKTGMESAITLGDLIDVTSAQARTHFDAGRNQEGRKAVERLVSAGRRFLALRPRPDTAAAAEVRDDARRQAHRFRQIADLAFQVRRFNDSIDFASKQIEFARAAFGPNDEANAERFTLLESGNTRLARAYVQADKLPLALEHWQEVVRLTAWTKLESVSENACRTIDDVGKKLIAAGIAADPASVIEPGIVEREFRLSTNQASPKTTAELRRAYRALGLILEFRREFARSLVLFSKGLELGQGINDAERELFRQHLLGRAVCLDVLDRESEADGAWQHLVSFMGQASATWALNFRMITLVQYGRPLQATRIAEQLLKRPDCNGSHKYNAACAFARASAVKDLPPGKVEELSHSAVSLVAAAKATGFFDDPGQWRNLKTDADLRPIRGRDNFKAILKQLEEQRRSPTNP